MKLWNDTGHTYYGMKPDIHIMVMILDIHTIVMILDIHTME